MAPPSTSGSSNGDIRKSAKVANVGNVEVTIPDLFVSLMAKEPEINPHYEVVRAESEACIIEKCKLDERTARTIFKNNFSFFSAVAAPNADAEGLRILCDWGNWVFPFDDMFDNGGLRSDPAGAQKMIKACLSILDGGNEGRAPETLLIEFHDTIWQRFLKNAPKGVQRRFAISMRDYLQGAVEHVEDHTKGKIPGLEEYLAIHRKAAGVMPIFALVEYADHLDIPDMVFEHPCIQEIQRVGTDVVLIQNDICSYLKEESEGVNHNIVKVCRNSGLSAQKAFDRVGELLKERYRDWYLAQAKLPQWGEHVDTQVQKYIAAVHNTMLANVNFSFQSERYFGDSRDVVRKNRTIFVQPDTFKPRSAMLKFWVKVVKFFTLDKDTKKM